MKKNCSPEQTNRTKFSTENDDKIRFLVEVFFRYEHGKTISLFRLKSKMYKFVLDDGGKGEIHSLQYPNSNIKVFIFFVRNIKLLCCNSVQPC